MLKFNEDAIKKDVEETLALRKDVEAAVKKICEKGYNNIFLVGIGGTYAVAEELMSYLKGHSKIEIYLENAADLTAEGNTKLGEKSGDHIGYRKYSGNDRCCALWQGKRSYDFWICG